MMTRNGRCPNFNHGRPNAPVRFCSMCGNVVNNRIPEKECSEEKHAKSRRERRGGVFPEKNAFIERT